MLHAAANYAVFPVGENKRPTRPKSEGGDGFKDASADPELPNTGTFTRGGMLRVHSSETHKGRPGSHPTDLSHRPPFHQEG